MNTDKQLIVNPTQGLYKWARIFNRLQRNFFVEPVELRREKQIKDFVKLNEYKNVKYITDTDVFLDSVKCEDIAQADLLVITDQKFSRYPCPIIVEKIKQYLAQCPAVYLCLNRHYINIDNSYRDATLDDNFNLAIAQWLRKALPDTNLIDLSLDYVDYGQHFTWAVPDRHYFLKSQ